MPSLDNSSSPTDAQYASLSIVSARGHSLLTPNPREARCGRVTAPSSAEAWTCSAASEMDPDATVLFVPWPHRDAPVVIVPPDFHNGC